MSATEKRKPGWTPADAEQTQDDAQIIARAEAKRASTCIAQLALHGNHVVHELRDGGYLVAWRGCTKHCRDLTELAAHARRVGALQ